MTITKDDLDNLQLFTLGGGNGHHRIVAKDVRIDRDRHDELGPLVGEHEWRVASLFERRDGDGDVFEAVLVVEADLDVDVVEEILPWALMDVPYLEEDGELPVRVFAGETVERFEVPFEAIEEERQDRIQVR